ncbi:MAG: tetratricopeptide repeat protein [Candidatus Promineifilaceae bacterium]|nr:tetratricopeptide repeat protein [Candidatus Promineifilaceae bacterium]
MAQKTNVIDVSEATFEQDVVQRSHQQPVVVDFWAAWCGPCRMLGPTLERLASEPGAGWTLAKVDVDANPGLSMRFGVQGIPAVKAFKDGRVVGQFVGAQPEPAVRQFLKSIAPSEQDRQATSAEEMLDERQWDGAEQLYRDQLTQNPDSEKAQLGLAKALLGQGQGCQAKPYLEAALESPSTHETAEQLLPVTDYLCAHGKGVGGNVELTPLEAQYRQAARLLAEGKIAPGLDGLLGVLRHNKQYREGQAHQVMLGVFALLGNDDPLTGAYRREMANVLF